MPYTLGIAPDTLTVFLYRDADFDSSLTRTDDAGAEVDWGVDPVFLLFTRDNAQWQAITSGSTASFTIDRVQTNTRQDGEPVELWVGEQCWAKGKCKRKGALE